MLHSITGTYSFIFSRFLTFPSLTFPIQSVCNLTFAHCFFLLSLLRSTFLCVFFPSSSLSSSNATLFSLFLPLFSFIFIFLFHCFLPSYFLPFFSLHFGPDSYNVIQALETSKLWTKRGCQVVQKVEVPYLINAVPQIVLGGSKQHRARRCTNLPLVGVHSC